MGNLYLTENQLSRNAMWCTTDNHNYICQICGKEFSDSNFIDKISIFHETAQILHTPNFKSKTGKRPAASTLYILMVGARKESTVSFLALVSP